MELHVSLEVEDGAEVRFEIFRAGAEGADGVSERTVHCAGRGSFEEREASEERVLDVPALVERCAEEVLDEAACYGKFAEGGIEYRGTFRGVESLRKGHGEVLAQLVRKESVPGEPWGSTLTQPPWRRPGSTHASTGWPIGWRWYTEGPTPWPEPGRSCWPTCWRLR